MNFINRKGATEFRALLAISHPRVVLPRIIKRPDNRSGVGGRLPTEGIRVALVENSAVTVGYCIFVDGTLSDVRNETLEYSRKITASIQLVRLPVPVVEVPCYGNLGGIRRPNRKINPGVPVVLNNLAAQFFIHLVMVPSPKQVDVLIGEQTVGDDVGPHGWIH